jgi:ferredoxin-thioredoxin reductase catalytic subunit/rubredoxin
VAKIEVSDKAVDVLYERLKREAEEGGYHLNPEVDFTKDLVRSLLINEKRYGYWACPCRLASGVKEDDLDIICPCDYRDADVDEYGSCYCALYVSTEIAEGKKKASSIPERRPTEQERKRLNEEAAKLKIRGAAQPVALPVWRCKVCGYLCARDGPPEICPVCKAKKDRFEKFIDAGATFSTPLPVWRCKVCGYLCARNEPPEICPVCKAKKDRFERFM